MAKEVIEEYYCDENGNLELTRKQITEKDVPPDPNVLNILKEDYDSKPIEMDDDLITFLKNFLEEQCDENN